MGVDVNQPTPAGKVSAAVVAENVVVEYSGRVALAGVSARWSSGCNVLLGPNGAGKSSLIRVIAGEQNPTRGTVQVTGSPAFGGVSRRSMRRQIGYAPQEAEIPGGMLVEDVVAYAGWLKRVPRASLARAVADALAVVDLMDRRRERAVKLSGGMRRRLALATAVVHRPQCLLLDEPTVGLDPDQRISVRHIVKKISTAACVLLSTHQLSDVEHFADRVTVLASGRIVFDGSSDQLAAAGSGALRGDTAVERGYLAVTRSVDGRSRS